MTDAINNPDLDALLDATLDDLEDLPTFKAFPVGTHRATVTLATKDINGKLAVTADFKYIEAVELAEADAVSPKVGDMSNTMFMMANEYGQGNFKKMASALAEGLGLQGNTNREIIEAVTDVEVLITTSLRPNTKDADAPFLNVKDIAVI